MGQQSMRIDPPGDTNFGFDLNILGQ